MKLDFAAGHAIRTVASALLTLMAASSANADSNNGPYYDHHGMMDWGGWIFGPLMMLIFFGLLVGAVLLIARVFGYEGLLSAGQTHDRAISILRERYAKGEITEEEFAAARKALE